MSEPKNIKTEIAEQIADLSKLLGMKTVEECNTIDEEFNQLEKNWNDYDFFYLHINFFLEDKKIKLAVYLQKFDFLSRI